MNTRDADAALRRTFASLSVDARARADCPAPERLWAAAVGELRPNETAALVDHIAECAACAEDWRLAADITHDAGLALSVEIAVAPTVAGWFVWPQMRAAFAALAVVIAAGTIVYQTMRTDGPAPAAPDLPAAAPAPAPPPLGPAPAPPAVDPFGLEKPDVELRPERAIPFRGTPDDGFIAAFGEAIAPYREEKFADAAERLAGVSRKYPQDPEPHFYLGISLLFLDRNAEAVQALDAARRVADPLLAPAIRWYLAAAYYRTGGRAEAVKELDALCRGSSAYAARACAARDRVAAAPGR